MDKIKGAKHDTGKPRPSLVPVEAIEAIMRTREYGMRKYGTAEEWRSIDAERWHEALLRHVLAIWENPIAIDPESGLPALWHVITNAAFLCAALQKELKDEMKFAEIMMEGGGMMRGAERTRRRLRTELHKRGIRINRLPEYIPYSSSTCYKYLNGSEPMTGEFAFQVQRVIDQWDNKKSARP